MQGGTTSLCHHAEQRQQARHAACTYLTNAGMQLSCSIAVTLFAGQEAHLGMVAFLAAMLLVGVLTI